jgi:hypothetical protein
MSLKSRDLRRKIMIFEKGLKKKKTGFLIEVGLITQKVS